MFLIFLSVISGVGAVTLTGSAEYAIPGRAFNLTCDVPEEASSVKFYRRPLMTQSPQTIQVTGDQCYKILDGISTLCTPDVCSCQPSTFQYASEFVLVIIPIPGDHNSLWFCRRENTNLTNPTADSTDYTLNVFEQVTSIELQNPPPPVTEFDVIDLVCVTSPCRPAASVLWSVGGLNYTSFSSSRVQGTILSFVTVSILTLQITRALHGRRVICSAYNTDDGFVFDTIQPILNVEYGPTSSIDISPSDRVHTGDEGDTLPDITCTADCRPDCTFVWTRPDNINFTVSPVLSLGQLKRSEQGNYTCMAVNNIGSSNVTYSLTVRYPPSMPAVILLPTNYWIEGEEYRVLSCIYSEGYPAPASVDWFRDGVSTGVMTSTIIIGPLRPEDNGVGYFCRVRNSFTDSKMTNLTSAILLLNLTLATNENKSTLKSFVEKQTRQRKHSYVN